MLFEYDQQRMISIPALREEGDATEMGPTVPRVFFYPRPPRGGRRLPIIAGLVSV